MKKKLLYGLPILVGVYLIFRQFKKSKQTDKTDVPPPAKTSTNSAAVITHFPLKKGSRNESVKTLQTILNAELSKENKPLLTVDGIFGSKTEAALTLVTGKNTVASAAELTAISADAGATSYIAQNLEYGWDLVEKYNTGNYRNIVVNQPMSITKVTKTLTGGWGSPFLSGKKIVDLAPIKYNTVDYAIRSVLNDGTLRIEITNGELQGMYVTEPENKLIELLYLQ